MTTKRSTYSKVLLTSIVFSYLVTLGFDIYRYSLGCKLGQDCYIEGANKFGEVDYFFRFTLILSVLLVLARFIWNVVKLLVNRQKN